MFHNLGDARKLSVEGSKPKNNEQEVRKMKNFLALSALIASIGFGALPAGIKASASSAAGTAANAAAAAAQNSDPDRTI